MPDLTRRIVALVKQIERHLEDDRRGEIIRDGIQCARNASCCLATHRVLLTTCVSPSHPCRVAILGPPNAGKSSLLNVLAKRPAAIVSNIPGTTRDVIEVRSELAWCGHIAAIHPWLPPPAPRCPWGKL